MADDEDDDDEVGDERAGRIVEPDEGAHEDTEAGMVGTDVGIDGAAASAEEAAMHVIPEDDERGVGLAANPAVSIARGTLSTAGRGICPKEEGF